MAYKDSGKIATGSSYNLGEYSFNIERSSVPGSTNDQITAICRQGDKSARKSIQIPSSANIEGWYVEANDTTADVYIMLKGLDVLTPIPSSSTGHMARDSGTYHDLSFDSAPGLVTYSSGCVGTVTATFMGASKSQNAILKREDSVGAYSTYALTSSYTYNKKTVYYRVVNTTSSVGANVVSVSPSYDGNLDGPSAWVMVYGDAKGFEELVGRFAINIGDAGGYPGGGGDWNEPGDYDPDWDPEDPTTTLYINVTGALSGRHNDPIEDPSYSYIPADKDTVKDYGCGGDGGHGGGGGAGASTVVIHKFATNQANSKEVTALARRHGYGSGGGKGGKGGDGCILIYY